MNKATMKINKKVAILIISILLETIFVKLFQYVILPKKYFYDSNKILKLTNGIPIATDKTYTFTANFFKTINIFKFTLLSQWSYAISFVSILLIILILVRNKKMSNKNFIFIIASVGLLNIYVFNISKDFIQFLIFYIIFLIINNKKNSNLKSLIWTCIILLIEAIYFRIYYAIMAMIIITIYWIYTKWIKEIHVNKKTVIKIISLALILFFAEIFIVQLVSYENYNSIMNARYSVNITRETSTDAVTVINDLLGKNKNFIIFILNYIINLIRMLFPIELIIKGLKYIPFIVYQLFITYTILKSSSKLNDKNIMWLITVISYIMVSVIFEPDFGSFIRHESSMFLILFEMNKIIDGYIEEY